MYSSVVLAILVCGTFWLFAPGAILVVDSWPVFQIFGLVFAVLSTLCWRWIKRSARFPVGTGLTDNRAFTFSILLGSIAIAAIAIPQSNKLLKEASVENASHKLVVLDEALNSLETGKGLPSGQSLDINDLEQRIASQKKKLTEMDPNSYRFKDLDGELRWCERWHAEYLSAGSRRLGCWYSMIGSVSFVIFGLVASGRALIYGKEPVKEANELVENSIVSKVG